MLGGNPALNDSTFDPARYEEEVDRSSVMTYEGTLLKSGTLIGITVVAASVTWGITKDGGNPIGWILGGAIGGLIFALITIFKPTTAPFTAPVYAVLEGLFLGAVSALYDTMVPAAFGGIVVQAVGLTMGVLAVMLVLYSTRAIRVTPKLAKGIIAATGAVVLFYLATFVLRMFGVEMAMLHDGGPIAIGISLVIVGIAAFNLLLDFDLIENGVKSQTPKYMEWYAGFALLVTLVWLYLEILRLLSYLNRE